MNTAKKSLLLRNGFFFYRKNATIMPNEMNGTRAKPSLLLRCQIYNHSVHPSFP